MIAVDEAAIVELEREVLDRLQAQWEESMAEARRLADDSSHDGRKTFDQAIGRCQAYTDAKNIVHDLLWERIR